MAKASRQAISSQQRLWRAVHVFALIDFLPQIGHKGYVLYTVLSAHQNPRTGQCNPSLATLAREVRASKTTVCKLIDALVHARLIEVRKDKRAKVSKDGRVTHYRMPNEYTLFPADQVLSETDYIRLMQGEKPEGWDPPSIELPEL